MVTQYRLKQLLNYDPVTGVFIWNVRRSTTATKGSVAGRIESKGYLQIGIDGIRYAAHRLAWLWVHGSMPKDVIDHINGKRLDNRIVNLRSVSFSENLHNFRKVHPHSKSGLLGVSYNNKTAMQGKPWIARIQRFGKRVYLGAFTTPEEAHTTYQNNRGT